jgi:hypothetical protein
MLHDYLKQTRRFLRDAKQDMLEEGDVIEHINEARRETAMRAQAIRVLTPIAAGLTSATVTSPGSGYTNPTVIINPPDFPDGLPGYPNGRQATALATLQGGQISGVDIQDGGAGYQQNPQITISDPTGSGAVIVATPIKYNNIIQGQEVYPWQSIDTSMFPGVGLVFWVQGITVIYANWRYSPQYSSFSKYQAKIRTYTTSSYQYVPAFFSQYGRGTNGSFYYYPPPSQTYPVEMDCLCLPIDLIDDTTPEAIPGPWTDAVKFYAAAMCYLDLQNGNKAREYFALYDSFMNRYGAYAMPGRMVNWYGGRPA